jgi:hypothetical protein
VHLYRDKRKLLVSSEDRNGRHDGGGMIYWLGDIHGEVGLGDIDRQERCGVTKRGLLSSMAKIFFGRDCTLEGEGNREMR